MGKVTLDLLAALALHERIANDTLYPHDVLPAFDARILSGIFECTQCSPGH
jgi:hypothetical protein